jgi:PHD/YefM family antitoxin component YafN of YafNO toxin-antitoxin module
MSLDDLNGMDETDYLLSTEANKKMMYEAKEQIESGLAVPVNISEMMNALEND